MLDVMRNTAFNSLHADLRKSSLANEAFNLFTLIIVCQIENEENMSHDHLMIPYYAALQPDLLSHL